MKEGEDDDKINFLDITVSKQHVGMKVSLCRKPMAPDLYITKQFMPSTPSMNWQCSGYLESSIKIHLLCESDKEMQIIGNILYEYQFMINVFTAKVKKGNSDKQNNINSMAVVGNFYMCRKTDWVCYKSD
jgi:hypothetical protein